MRIKSQYKSENAPLQKEERLGAQTDSKPCLVEATGFEPAASASRTQRSTKLSHASTKNDINYII